MKFLIALALLSAASAFTCYSWECADLDENICAEYADNVISVNENGCSSGYTCGLMYADLKIYVDDETSVECVSEAAYNALDDDDTLNYPSDYDWANSEECEPDEGYNLKSGSFPKNCESDEDCLLVNGGTADCWCGFNGVGYCMPSLKSDYFDDWHSTCEDGDADEDSYLEAVFKATYLPFIETLQESSEYDCMNDIFEDFEDYEDYSDVEDSAQSLVFGLLGLLALLA
jgi:hypothetical protein